MGLTTPPTLVRGEQIAPSRPAPHWRAELALRFSATHGERGPRSVLSSNRHIGPLLVQKALYPEGDAVCHAVLLHPPAGVAAGDQLVIGIDVEAGAHAVLSTPSATRWYKSGGVRASQEVRLRIGPGAALEWLPEENLFYESVRADQSLDIELGRGARLLAWDAFMLGRSARGERWLDGDVLLSTRITRAGELIYVERGRLDGADPQLDTSPGLGGLRCGATLFAVAERIDTPLLEGLGAVLNYHPELKASCSQLAAGFIIVRILGREAEPVRQLLQRAWSMLRPAVIGVPAQPLRLWAC